MMIRDSRHEVAIDDLIVSEQHAVRHSDGYWFNVLGREFTFGDPVPVDVVLSSLMQDGELVRTVGHNNREAGFFVEISGTDGKALALGEQRLWLALQQARELRWTPPDGIGATTVFDVIAARMNFEFDDMDELRTKRTYKVLLNCLPFGRGATLITRTFPKGSPTYTTVDACSATAGWSGQNATLSVATVGADQAILATTAGDAPFGLTRDAMGIGSATYVAVDVRLENAMGIDQGWGFGDTYIGGRLAVPLAAIPSPVGAGLTRYFYTRPLAGGSLRLEVIPRAETGFARKLFVGGVYSATAIPGGSLSVLDVEGSARTPASVSWRASTGPAILYADQTMLTHGWLPNDASTWSRCPAGTYMLWDGTDGISSGVSTITLNDTYSEVVRVISGAVARPRGFFTLGAGRDGRAGTLNWKKAGGAALDTTGMRLFRCGDPDDQHGPTSLIRLPGASLTPLVQVDVPSREFPRGGVWVNGVDATDRCASWGTPIIAPPLTALYVEGATDPQLTLTYYPRHHTHAVA